MIRLASLRLPLLSLVALIASTSVGLRAADPFLAPGTVVATELLTPPPLAGSAEDLADRTNAFAVYSARTPAEFALGKSENKLTIFHLAGEAVPAFQPGKFPLTEALFARVEKETKTITDAGKSLWKRPRPYHTQPDKFPDVIEKEDTTHYSYPSGHSTRGTVFALILAELFPGQRDAILAKGREAGWVRVQGGVHCPTDTYAGRVLGQALAHAFLRSPQFQHELELVRAELASAH